jgi:hypothetical protein
MRIVDFSSVQDMDDLGTYLQALLPDDEVALTDNEYKALKILISSQFGDDGVELLQTHIRLLS